MKEKLKQLAIRLRIEERKSLNEIQKIVKVPKPTVYYWLKKFPLSKEEKTSRTIQRNKTKKPKKYKVKQNRYKDETLKSKHYPILEIEKQRFGKIDGAKKGDLSEAMVCFLLRLHNFEIYTAISNGAKVDFIVRNLRKPQKLIRIQVKTARMRKGYNKPVVPLMCGNNKDKKYTKNDFDVIIAYNLFLDECYIFTYDEIKNKKTYAPVTPDSINAWDKLQKIS